MSLNPKQAMDILYSFKTDEALARFLTREGVKGIRQDSESCPISTWLSEQTGFAVSTDDNVTFYENWDTNQGEEGFPVSEAMVRFIHRFDASFDYHNLDIDWDPSFGYTEYLEDDPF